MGDETSNSEIDYRVKYFADVIKMTAMLSADGGETHIIALAKELADMEAELNSIRTKVKEAAAAIQDRQDAVFPADTNTEYFMGVEAGYRAALDILAMYELL